VGKAWLGVSAAWKGRFFPVSVISFFFLLAVAGPLAAEDTDLPVRGTGSHPNAASRTITMARATWDTGWFQTEIFVSLLEKLGYDVSYPKTMDNRSFYLAAANGEVDLWVNGWFPSHNVFLKQENVRDRVQPVGFEVIDGALQGYLVDRGTAERLGIKGIADLRNPDLAAVFDRDSDGKADLIGCNTGWGCERVIEHHLGVYNLRATVEHVQGDYSPLMDETIRRYREGKPVLFYTYTPNWTVGELVPGKDVVWLEVPFPSLPIDHEGQEDQTIIKHVPGCLSDPCAMGFPPNDIRGVANIQFLKRHPDIRHLLESVTIPLKDISHQNARMIRGEDTYDDIRRHAREWIAANRIAVESWLQASRRLQGGGAQETIVKDPAIGDKKSEALRVVTLRSEPFVIYRDGQYAGFSIELWKNIAREIGVEYSVYGVNTIAKLLDEVYRGAADIAVAGIGITSERERDLDFSHPYFVAGLQIMISEGYGSALLEVLSKIHSVLFSPEALYAFGIFIVVLFVAAHVIWMLESRDNPQFPRTYLRGLWESVWWAVVTVTTVGYGDKTPRRAVGRLFGIVWILAGYFVFAYFTASITTTATVQEIHGTINDPQDLYGKKVASIKKSTAAAYLKEQGIAVELLENVDAAYRLLENGKVEAIVYDAPVLQHYAATMGKGEVRVVGLVFEEKNYGLVFPFGSSYREKVNVALLKIIEEGVYRQIKEKWFGS
jgi:ABC-type proline/glycine betaine transport system substrate-binding protein/ABC-type amino acid transport substrate-binding protein